MKISTLVPFELSKLQESIAAIKSELGSVIVGQHKMIDQLLNNLSNGHVY
jgi:MoxR-like ATPase